MRYTYVFPCTFLEKMKFDDLQSVPTGKVVQYNLQHMAKKPNFSLLKETLSDRYIREKDGGGGIFT
jgi:hypothetical protein